MYSNQRALAQEVKREVIAELQQGNSANIPQFGGYPDRPGYGIQEQGGAYTPFAPDKTYQMIKDSVKNEIMAEIQTQQINQMAQVYGLDRPLSDQRIQQLIEARYRTIDNLKAEIKKELLALQGMETQRAKDPYVRQTASALAEEARRQGIPREQLMQSLEQGTTRGGGLVRRLLDTVNVGQRKGFLGGVALMLLCNLIFPSAHKTMHSVAVRSMEEGMAMVDRAKSFVHGRQQQNPFRDLNSPVPEPPQHPPPPPGGEQPPEGGE